MDIPLVSPVDGSLLCRERDCMVAPSGKRYPIRDNILDLLDYDLVDAELQRELNTFESLPIDNVCYFRQNLFREIVELISNSLNCDGNAPVHVEMGGGEGYLATALKRAMPGSITCVCDLSLKQLRNAPVDLIRIRCDMRRPFLAPNSADISTFWVSLHHLRGKDLQMALEQGVAMLKPGGLLVIFEPNLDFLPRRLLLNSFIKKAVYYDEHEHALRFVELETLLRQKGLECIFVTGHNPPYSLRFLYKLRWGLLFFPFVEPFHLGERLYKLGYKNWWNDCKRSIHREIYMLKYGSYFLAIFRKA